MYVGGQKRTAFHVRSLRFRRPDLSLLLVSSLLGDCERDRPLSSASALQSFSLLSVYSSCETALSAVD